MNNKMLKGYLIVSLIWLSLEGCMVWPVMTETMGYRPIEMGKRDQVFWPEAPRPTDLSSDFGDSQRMAKDSQIIDPEASKNLEPVEGLDGVAGNKAMRRYQKSFDRPAFAGQTNKTSGGSKK